MEGSDSSADARDFFDELLSVYGADDEDTEPVSAEHVEADDGDEDLVDEAEYDGDEDLVDEAEYDGDEDLDEADDLDEAEYDGDEDLDEADDLDEAEYIGDEDLVDEAEYDGDEDLDEADDLDEGDDLDEAEYDGDEDLDEVDDGEHHRVEGRRDGGELDAQQAAAEIGATEEAQEVAEDPSPGPNDALENVLDERHEDLFEAELVQSLQHEKPAGQFSSLADRSGTRPDAGAPDAEALTKEVWPAEPTWLDEPSPLIEEALAVQSGVRTLRSEPVSNSVTQTNLPAVKRAPRELNASLIIGGLLVVAAVVLGVLLVLT